MSYSIGYCEKKQNMALQSDYCENSELYCTTEDFVILTELPSPFTHKDQMKS